MKTEGYSHGRTSRETGLAINTVKGYLKRLEERGFAERIKHPTDRRSVLVRTVEQGDDTAQRPVALQKAV